LFAVPWPVSCNLDAKRMHPMSAVHSASINESFKNALVENALEQVLQIQLAGLLVGPTGCVAATTGPRLPLRPEQGDG
jgi:hypothetical protein